MIPRACPWYVAALAVVHAMVGVVLALFGFGAAFSLLWELVFRTSPVEGGLVALGVTAAAIFTLLGAGYLWSAQCIRRKSRRRYSVLCGAFLCFGGPLAVLGLLTIYGLTRPAAVEYYESDAGPPGFPVTPAPPPA